MGESSKLTAGLRLRIGVGGVHQRLAAFVAVGAAAAGGIPDDAALGVAGRVFSAVGGGFSFRRTFRNSVRIICEIGLFARFKTP